MRVRGTVEYLGTKWAGWQLQPDQPTVQGELERALAIFTRSPVRVHSSGRTDAGVHASGQVIAFDVADDTDLERLFLAVNALTDKSISIVDLARANDAFDPRRHALSRTYEYTIVNARPPSPFLRDRSWHVIAPLDLEQLQRLARMLAGEHDFAAFRAADCESPSTRRFVTESVWTRDGAVYTYRVSANAFLKQMVRTLVGSMVDVVVGKLDEETFVELLGGGSRMLNGRTAPAAGLSLVRVEYPPELEHA
ncbi:MAG TPA: tRNA pseudouridine(38-40) synthase TruA [Candidatus Limnocylindrales bacterium]|nr:tRNA pseudouridine(38-40) synthase TruA [Candidatus Limnocylindrales bacterium]